VSTDETSNSTFVSHTQEFVKLTVMLDLEESQLGLSLATFKPPSFRQITWLPMPEEVIKLLNERAAMDKKFKSSKDSILANNNLIIEYESTQFDDISTLPLLPPRISPSGMANVAPVIIDLPTQGDNLPRTDDMHPSLQTGVDILAVDNSEYLGSCRTVSASIG
jgi:hypothetical protein